MYTIEKYMNNIILLSKSLGIKHHDIGIIINMGIYATTGIKPSADYKTWKYYLNISGVAHSTNNIVMVSPVEGGPPLILTTSMLDTHPATRVELDLRTSMYNNLILEYPDDIMYINGCIFPVDINTAIAAKDGAVLSYSKQYVEPQEFSLIRELSNRIHGFFSRWYIKEYNITDSLYMSSVMNVLFANLPNLIADIRLNDTYTAEAHSFHVEHFFRSHLDIWSSVQYLDETTQRWLYKNLVTLINNVGTEETFNTIVNKIFAANGIGLANYKLTQANLTHKSLPALNESIFSRNEPIVTTNNLTDYYLTSTPRMSLSDVVNKQMALSSLDPVGKPYSQNTLDMITRKDITLDIKRIQDTKVIDFGTIELFKLYNNDVIGLSLDVWLDLAISGRYNGLIKIIDPNNKDIYELTPYTGIILFYYLFNMKLGLPDDPISSIRYTNMVNTQISKNFLTTQLITATGTNYAASLITTELSNISKAYHKQVRNANDINNIVNAYTKMYSDIWTLDSNVNNAFLSGNIKRMVERTLLKNSVNITMGNGAIPLGTILNNNGIAINITPGYNIDKVLAILYKSFTGSTLHKEDVIAEVYNSHRSLLNKLTSYTLQIIPPVVTAGAMTAPYSSIAVAQADMGYIQIEDASIIKVIEDNNSTISSSGDDYIDQLLSVSNRVVRTLIDSTSGIKLYAKRLSVSVDRAIPMRGIAMAEIVRGSYDIFAPNHSVIYSEQARISDTEVANNNNNIIRRDNASNPMVFTKIQDISMDSASVTNAIGNAEVLASSHNVFIPSNMIPISDNVGIGNGVVNNTNNIVPIVDTAASAPTVTATIGNTAVTKPSTYGQILPK